MKREVTEVTEEDTKTRDTIIMVVVTITETTMEVDTGITEVVVTAEVADVDVVVITTETTMMVIKEEETLVVIGILAAIEIMIMSNKNQDLYQENNLSNKSNNSRRCLIMVKTNNNLKEDSFKGNKVKITNETSSSKTTVTISMIITEAETTTTETIATIMEEAKVEEIKFMSVTWTMILTKKT